MTPGAIPEIIILSSMVPGAKPDFMAIDIDFMSLIWVRLREQLRFI